MYNMLTWKLKCLSFLFNDWFKVCHWLACPSLIKSRLLVYFYIKQLVEQTNIIKDKHAIFAMWGIVENIVPDVIFNLSLLFTKWG